MQVWLLQTEEKGTDKPQGVLGYSYKRLERAMLEVHNRDNSCKFYDHIVIPVDLDTDTDIYYIVRQHDRATNAYKAVISRAYSDMSKAKEEAIRCDESYPSCKHYISQIVIHED